MTFLFILLKYLIVTLYAREILPHSTTFTARKRKRTQIIVKPLHNIIEKMPKTNKQLWRIVRVQTHGSQILNPYPYDALSFTFFAHYFNSDGVFDLV